MIEWLNHWGDAWSRYAVLIVVQNTLFLGFLFGLLELLKRYSARLRYAVALTGLAKLVLPLWLPLPAKAPLPIMPMGTPTPVTPVTSAMPVAPPEVTLSGKGLLLALWIVCMAALILIPVIRTVMLRWRLRHAEPWGTVPLGQRAIAVLRTSHVPMPMVLGLWPRAIYVPWQWPAWTPRCQAIALGHELAHIHRRDGLASVLGLVVQALYFFHPLVWMLGHRIHALREMACDDAAQSIEQGCTSISYSRALVEIAERMVEPEWTGVSASALIKRKHELLNRIQYQMEAAMRQTSTRVKAGLTLALVLLFAALSWTQDTPKQQVNDKGTVRGIIKNSATNQPLYGVNVFIRELRVGGVTDQEGKFQLEIPAGNPYDVEFTFLNPELTGPKGARGSHTVTVEAGKETYLEMVMISPSFQVQSAKIGDIKFYSYDEPPQPKGGWGALKANLVYPEAVEKDDIDGQVMVYAYIDTTGKVTETRIIKSPNEALNEASINAVKKTEWIPAKKEGNPVSVWVMVPIVFKAK